MDALKSWPCKTLLVAGTFLLAAAVVGCGPGTERAAPAMTMEEACLPVRPKEDPRIARVRRALKKPIDVSFKNTPLLTAIQILSEKSGVAVIPDPILNEDGDRIPLPILDLSVRGVAAEELLNLILTDGLNYTLCADGVKIRTDEQMTADLVVAVYPAVDLKRLWNVPPGLGLCWELFDVLKCHVNSMLDPCVAAWSDEGGAGTMDYFGGALIIVQTPHGQQRIASLLATLRAALAVEGLGQPVGPPESGATERVRRYLAKGVDVDFDETPLPTVLELLRASFDDLNIVVDQELQFMGLDLSIARITLHRKGVSVDEILNLALGFELGYRVAPGYVFISTRDRLMQNLPVVMYPVRQLLAWPRPSRKEAGSGQETGSSTPTGTESGFCEDGSWQGVFGELSGVQISAEQELESDGLSLVEILERTINPRTNVRAAAWTDEGGPATIDYYGGVLIVTQTPEGHERIAELLALLREGLARVDRQLKE